MSSPWVDEPGGPCLDPGHTHTSDGPWADDGARNTAPAPRRTTALGIPCPWSGDEHDPTPRSYAAWHWLYRTTRRIRHRIGLHDWVTLDVPGTDSRYVWCRCTWCGRAR